MANGELDESGPVRRRFHPAWHESTVPALHLHGEPDTRVRNSASAVDSLICLIRPGRLRNQQVLVE